MVQLMKSANLPAGMESPVKLEIVDDSLEEQHGPLNKRFKTSHPLQQDFPVQPHYDPLDEPSPLGLRLRKSPSLLDLIQMKLSQRENPRSGAKKESKGGSGSIDKLKASNFPGSVLRIGSWEYTARYEGELVAKCYFAKHKLVWEVLEGGLKSKIEIQWSDIMGLKANCPDEGPGTLNVVLARPPLFFRETNPQPRKHTLWQTTADFTNGQASIHKQHFLQCPQGMLNKHFEKLIQCDMRLNVLSQQPEMVLDSPYFEQRTSVFIDLDESNDQKFNSFETEKGSYASHSSSFEFDRGGHTVTSSEHMSREAPSPSSVMDTHAIEGRGNFESVDSRAPRNWDQINVPGLTPSMSMSDFMNHIENCITGQMNTGNTSLAADGEECHAILEDIAQYLLSDTQLTTSSDEKRIMSRVNSLCCLLQKDPTTSSQNLQTIVEGSNEESDNGKVFQLSQPNGSLPAIKPNGGITNTNMNTNNMPRKDSFGDLLLNLPRIASLPQFLFQIREEDGEFQNK
ncbi:hypothetical protein LINPERPRIM_LOCUS34492 [Linum perenne]